jgi:signal transduction histidine kinase
MMSGALWLLRIEGRLRAAQEAKASSEAELARIQDRFLNRFAVELAEINKKIKATLETHKELKDHGGTLTTAYVRALGSSEELDDYLQGIHQFASLPTGKSVQRAPLDAVDLEAVTSRVLRQFESRKRELRIDTVVVKDGAGPFYAHADRMLVGQILYNLISNAIKYSPQGRTVTVTLSADAQAATVTVRDEGPGIAPEFQERIFEKFYRVKDDHVYKLKGHGLGLYLSRYFAEEIGAALTVRSTPGQGAAFALSLKPGRRA